MYAKTTESVPRTSSSSIYDKTPLALRKKKAHDYRPNTICMNALASFVSKLAVNDMKRIQDTYLFSRCSSCPNSV